MFAVLSVSAKSSDELATFAEDHYETCEIRLARDNNLLAAIIGPLFVNAESLRITCHNCCPSNSIDRSSYQAYLHWD